MIHHVVNDNLSWKLVSRLNNPNMFRATPNALPEIIVRLLKVGLNKLLGHV